MIQSFLLSPIVIQDFSTDNTPWDVQLNILAIPGSSNPDHIRENLDIFNFSLSDEEMQKIAQLNRNEKHDWY